MGLEHATMRKKSPQPWHPARYEDADIYAVQALAGGTANSGQQKRALEWILIDLCGVRDLSFRTGAEEGRRATDFAEGKRFVGLQIAKLMNLRPAGKATAEGIPVGSEPKD